LVKVKLSLKIQFLDLNENPKKYIKYLKLEQNEFIIIKLLKGEKRLAKCRLFLFM